MLWLWEGVVADMQQYGWLPILAKGVVWKYVDKGAQFPFRESNLTALIVVLQRALEGNAYCASPVAHSFSSSFSSSALSSLFSWYVLVCVADAYTNPAFIHLVHSPTRYSGQLRRFELHGRHTRMYRVLSSILHVLNYITVQRILV